MKNAIHAFLYLLLIAILWLEFNYLRHRIEEDHNAILWCVVNEDICRIIFAQPDYYGNQFPDLQVNL